MLRPSVNARGMSTTVRYKWVFSSHNMKKLAVPGKLGMSVTVFALNSQVPTWVGAARPTTCTTPGAAQAHRLFLTQRARGPFAGALLPVATCAWSDLTKIVRQRGHGAIKGRQNWISGTVGHTMCPKAHNNEDQRLIHTVALPRKANNAFGCANQRLPGHRGEWQRVPWLRQTSKTEWDKVPVHCTSKKNRKPYDSFGAACQIFTKEMSTFIDTAGDRALVGGRAAPIPSMGSYPRHGQGEWAL